MNGLSRAVSRSMVLLGVALSPAAGQSYHIVNTFTLGGDGGWDYLALDTVGHRLFIAHRTASSWSTPTAEKCSGRSRV